MSLTPEQQATLNRIRQEASIRHENERQKAKRRGRNDFPLMPYEHSWAFEMEFLREYRREVGE